MLTSHTTIVGQRVLIFQPSQASDAERKLLGRGIVHAVDYQEGRFVLLVETVGKIDWLGGFNAGDLLTIYTNSALAVAVDRDPVP